MTNDDNTNEPITHGGPDRRYKLCKCSKCGKVETCTPRSDFYTLGKGVLGPLYCESCFHATWRKLG